MIRRLLSRLFRPRRDMEIADELIRQAGGRFAFVAQALEAEQAIAGYGNPLDLDSVKQRIRIVSTRYQPAKRPSLENEFHKRLAAEIGWKRRTTA